MLFRHTEQKAFDDLLEEKSLYLAQLVDNLSSVVYGRDFRRQKERGTRSVRRFLALRHGGVAATSLSRVLHLWERRCRAAEAAAAEAAAACTTECTAEKPLREPCQDTSPGESRETSRGE